MKKTLKSIILIAGMVFGFTSSAFSQDLKSINPKKMERSEVIISNESYKDRYEKIHSIKYDDYQEMLKEVKDPRDAEIYCTTILNAAEFNEVDKTTYGKEDYWASFEESYVRRFGDCDEGAIAAASLLWDNGFHPYFLYLTNEKVGHFVFIYRNQEGKYGTIGINKEDCKESKYKNIENLVYDFNKGSEKEEHYEWYGILDAQNIFPDAISEEKDYSKNFTKDSEEFEMKEIKN